MGTPFGRYELVRKIAAGGMAEIFLARQTGQAGFRRDVVVKRLFTNLAENSTTLRMFQVEANLLAHLTHPNIPQVMDLGFVDGYWYMVMEYIEGSTIADLWRAGARRGVMMPLPVTIAAVMQVCEALQHAHDACDRAGRPLRIVHRDVNPHNIMVSPGGVIKLMDFGVARTDARQDTEAGTIKGTFSYMAPEQVRSQPLDKRADVFSLGVILYELTTGTRLFRGSDVEVMMKVVEQDAPPPSTRVEDYPADLEEIVLAALRRDPRSRIASASDLALHLEYFAMRHGFLVGPRAVAEFVHETFPTTRAREAGVGIVKPPPETDSGEIPVGRPPEPNIIEDVQDDDYVHVFHDLELEDLEVIESEPPVAPEAITNAPESSRVGSVPPAPLAGFDDEMLQSADRPVVLLDSKKEGEQDDYLVQLARRLEETD